MANGKKTDQRRIEAAERRQQVLMLRKSGAAFRAIGARLGISEAQAHRDYRAAMAHLAELEQDSAKELRIMELVRLDTYMVEAARIMMTTHPLVSGGKVLSRFTNDGAVIGLTDDGPKLAAIDRLLRISESRRKLLGLDPQTPIVMEQPYVLSGSERIARLIELLDAARSRAAGQPVIDVTPEPGDVAE